jgi:acetylornithine deacetylase/succinyl-diaminopimelate desuccinylase-like protein
MSMRHQGSGAQAHRPDAGSVGSEHEAISTVATELLQKSIRFNTVNPPGAERAIQEYLAAQLTAAGFACELLEAAPGRPNLVARLRSVAIESGTPSDPVEQPTLCFLGHVDTVLASPEEWTHDPWSGDIADGYLWGRGALDMKSQVAAEIAAAIALARSGWRPARGELLIAAVVDEETGGSLGAQWITQTHPDKVRCDLLLNEGGGPVFEYDGKRRYGVCCAEKGVFRFTVTTDGVAGHASLPKIGVNALLKMAPVLAALGAAQPSYAMTVEPRAFLQGLGESPDDPVAAIARMAAIDPRLVTMFEPMFGVTFTPTRIRASEKINVIPSLAELKVDCRVPPGLGEPQVRQAIAEVLGPEDGFRIDFTEQVVGNRSPLQSPLMDAIGDWIGEHDPGAATVPVILPGFTDSRHFRLAFPDCVAYGFFPHRHQTLFESAPLVHGADERIDLRDLAYAARFFRDIALRILG